MEFEKIIQLIQTVSESNLTGFRYEENGVKLCLKKENGQIQGTGNVISRQDTVPADGEEKSAAGAQNENAVAALTAESAAVAGGKIVKSPLVGVFYTAPAEGAEPYVSVGDTVKKGQVLATVEAMKLMNEIESEYDGVVEEILAENGQGVGYGEPLFVLR